MTLIVLLILAGISLSAVFSEKGIFNKAETAGAKYNEAKAREVLETVLLADGQYEKNINPEYNQDDFLNELIINEIPGTEIKGDVAIIGEWAFELDRSVPKIGRGLGNVKDLIFPAVTVAEITQADKEDNYRTAKIEITATIDEKAKNGINRIEIWQNGVKLETITCNNQKTVTKQYIANRNGKYTIKAYSEITDGEISGSARTTVEGIVPAVEFLPNGNTNWQKSHTTTVKVTETEETVTEMKYLWKKNNEGQPQESDFNSAESCTNNSQITGQGETMTGEYYLWVLITLETGTNQRTYISGSEEFYFDNEGPEITSFISNPTTDTSFTLTAETKCNDGHSEISTIKFYIDGEAREPNSIEKGLALYTWQGTEMVEEKECYVVVTDTLGNVTSEECIGRTKLFTWRYYDINETYTWKLSEPKLLDCDISYGNNNDYTAPVITRIWVNSTGGVEYDSSNSYTYGVVPRGAKIRSVGGAGSSSPRRLTYRLVTKTHDYDSRKDYYSGGKADEYEITSYQEKEETPGAYRDIEQSSNATKFPINDKQDGFWYIKVENM